MNALDIDVPEGERPAAECAYCGRPFRSAELCALHVGEIHPDECTDEEREAFAAAREAESDELFVYHLKVVAALVVLFMGFSYLYAFVLV